MRETVSIVIKEINRFKNLDTTSIDYNVDWYGRDMQPVNFFARVLVNSSNFAGLGVFKDGIELKRSCIDPANIDNEIRAVVRRYADTH